MKTAPSDTAQAEVNARAGGRSIRVESWKRHAAALLCLGCLCGCSSTTDSRDVPSASPLATASTSTPSPTTPATHDTGGSSPSPSHSTSHTTNQAGDLLLAQQIQTVVGGDGQGPDCRNEHPDGSPAAYISDGLASPGDAAMLEHVGLCLTGFKAGQAVSLTVTAGSSSHSTTVTLDSKPVDYPDPKTDREEMTLFDGLPVTVYPLAGSPYYQSGAWRFLPTESVRAQIVAAGSLTIIARQGVVSSKSTQRITLPPGHTGPAEFPLGNGRWAFYGFKPGLRVPVGLYRGDGADATVMTLVRQIGTVTIPTSGITTFTVARDVITNYGGYRGYCVVVPVTGTVDGCQF
jgi:hypothetical protein